MAFLPSKPNQGSARHLRETTLVSGTVAYPPEPLDTPASGNALLCCAVPDSEIVLDL